jgi:hypoxanthine-DNA glycosylase
MTKLIQSMPPISARDARVLILGSMPGARSLAASQYYANPRNAFWQIMQHVFDVDANADYAERIQGMKRKGIALWDVLRCCERSGSLDTAIRPESVEVNDFNSFLRLHPDIRTVIFNGNTAHRFYRLYVLPALERDSLEYRVMPSTSPAHATRSLEQKIAAWRAGVAGTQAALSGVASR